MPNDFSDLLHSLIQGVADQVTSLRTQLDQLRELVHQRGKEDAGEMAGLRERILKLEHIHDSLSKQLDDLGKATSKRLDNMDRAHKAASGAELTAQLAREDGKTKRWLAAIGLVSALVSSMVTLLIAYITGQAPDPAQGHYVPIAPQVEQSEYEEEAPDAGDDY